MRASKTRQAGTAEKPTIAASKGKHLFRVIVMFLSGGFIFPNALTENDPVPPLPGQRREEPKTGK